MRSTLALALGGVALGILALPEIADAQSRKPPYYASISAGQARMRTGPGKNYPATWLYQRAGLPIRVIGVYKEWRKVEDPDGAQGWMQANLLSEKRTGLIVDGIAHLRATPAATGPVQWRASQGVVGRVSRCARGWCWFDVRGRGGFVEQGRLWGVDPGEDVD